VTELFAWALVGLGFGVVAVRRRTLAVALVTTQALLLLVDAIYQATETDALLAATALGVRTLGLAAFLFVLIMRTRDPRLVRPGVTPLRRLAMTAALALALIWLIPGSALPSATQGRAVIALIAVGLVVAATSRGTLLQVLGIVVIENALVLAALGLPGTSWLIELGLAFDLILLAVVAGVFHKRIFEEFGVGDTAVLRSLRD
jgi:hydrogenase-4 component E